MKNLLVKIHFLYVFQQKNKPPPFSLYTIDYLTVKQKTDRYTKSFSIVTPKPTYKKQACDTSQACFCNKVTDKN